MHRNSLLEMSSRVMHQLVRMTLNKGNDNPMMQELNFDGMNSDGRNFVERVQAFGMSTVPLPRDEQQGGDSGGGGGGGNGESPKGPAAEGIAAFIGGQRNHPVVLAIDDRRHRPMGLKPGESFQYDHQGQGTLIRQAATYILSLDDDGSGSAPGGKMLKGPDGRATSQSQQQERFVSIRHVVKKKQDRSNSSGGGSGASAQANLKTWEAAGYDISKMNKVERAMAERSPNREQYKHEGDQVNTEIRCNKNRIEFRIGDNVVGYYDKTSTRWSFTGEMRLGSDDASHPVYGVNGGVGMTTVPSGSGAVLVKAPQPGPPTSIPDAAMQSITALEARIAALEARLNNG